MESETVVQAETEAPEASGGLTPEQVQMLDQLGVQLRDGMVDPAEHLKMFSSIRALRDQVKAHEGEKRASELAAMSETERAVTEARQAGYDAAVAESRDTVTGALVSAAAAAAGFLNPADAGRFLDLSAIEDVEGAVAALAKERPYLTRVAAAPGLPQGPRGAAIASDSDWLGTQMRARR
jgi:hypothetical protein